MSQPVYKIKENIQIKTTGHPFGLRDTVTVT